MLTELHHKASSAGASGIQSPICLVTSL
jgi:hypothetical protein